MHGPSADLLCTVGRTVELLCTVGRASVHGGSVGRASVHGRWLAGKALLHLAFHINILFKVIPCFTIVYLDFKTLNI